MEINKLEKATEFVKNEFKTHDNTKIIYHDLAFTLQLLERLQTFKEKENLDHKELLLAEFVFLFSNLGFLHDYHNPFKKNIEIFNQFSVDHELDTELTERVVKALKCLDNKEPEEQVEKIILDIYFLDYGLKKFDNKSLLLQKEIELNKKVKITREEWSKTVYNLLTTHKFYTLHAINNCLSEKRKNIYRVLSDLDSIKKVEHKEEVKAFYKQKYKDESPERSIQTLYRTVLRNHIKLSDIADTKANILLSVNAIIISLIIANIVSQFNNPDQRYLILPTIIFVFFSVISMMISIKATQPNVTRRDFTEKDIRDKKVNLAFFGNFHKIEFKRFQEAFNQLITRKHDVYNTLTKDLYYLGLVLDSKYRLLRYTYLVFMIGFVVSIIAFTFAFIYRDSFTL